MAPISPVRSATRPMHVGVHGLARRLGGCPPSIPRYQNASSRRSASARCPVRWRAASPTSGWPSLRWRREMSAIHWWAPAPLVGPPAPKRAAICVAPDGLETHPQVAQAVRDAGTRLQAMGWQVDELATTPPLAEAADAQTILAFVDGYADKVANAERGGRRWCAKRAGASSFKRPGSRSVVVLSAIGPSRDAITRMADVP